MNVELIKTFVFEAAHRHHGGGGRSARMHGHSYQADVVVAGPVDPRLGWLIDYGEIAAHFRPLYEELDHFCLNDVPGLDSVSVGDVRAWLCARLKPNLPGFKDAHVSITGPCRFLPTREDADSGLGLPERVGLTFEAAHVLPMLPDGHKCRRLHGHSFRIEVGAPDLSGLTPPLEALYDAVDHRYLNEIAGLDNATSETLSRWAWEFLTACGAPPTAIIVQETCTARCVYHGD